MCSVHSQAPEPGSLYDFEIFASVIFTKVQQIVQQSNKPARSPSCTGNVMQLLRCHLKALTFETNLN